MKAKWQLFFLLISLGKLHLEWDRDGGLSVMENESALELSAAAEPRNGTVRLLRLVPDLSAQLFLQNDCSWCLKFLLWDNVFNIYLAEVGPFVNLGIGTSALELELELELIQQTPLFPVTLGLWTPDLAGWWFRMRGLHPQSHVTLWCCGHVTNKKRYISTLTRPMDHKLSRVVTWDEGPSSLKSRGKSKMLYIHFHKAYWPQT